MEFHIVSQNKMLLFRSVCQVSRNITKFNNGYTRNVLINTLRCNSNVAQLLRSPKIKKKEPQEILKWILLMMPVTAFGLGCWQVHRLQWKLEMISILQAKSNSAPIDLPTDLESLQDLEYRPVKVRGEFLHDKEICIGPRAVIEPETGLERPGSLVSDPKKNQGLLVITPFKLEDTGKVILINRGWIPQKNRPKEKRPESLVSGPVELVGVVRLTEKRAPFMPKNKPESGSWYYRDLEQMSEYIGSEPVWLDARGTWEPPAGWPIPNQTRVTLRNEHMSYIVTWFSLSAFTGVMWHRYFIRKLPLL